MYVLQARAIPFMVACTIIIIIIIIILITCCIIIIILLSVLDHVIFRVHVWFINMAPTRAATHGSIITRKIRRHFEF